MSALPFPVGGLLHAPIHAAFAKTVPAQWGTALAYHVGYDGYNQLAI